MSVSAEDREKAIDVLLSTNRNLRARTAEQFVVALTAAGWGPGGAPARPTREALARAISQVDPDGRFGPQTLADALLAADHLWAEQPSGPNRLDPEFRATLTEYRSILGVLAQFPQPLTIKQLAIRAGSSAKSSTYTGALALLKRHELIVGDAKGMSITDAGRLLAGPVAPMPTGPELLEWWRGKLKPTEHRALTALVSVLPGSMSQQDLADTIESSPTSSTFTSAVAALRQQELISGDRTALYAAEVFGS